MFLSDLPVLDTSHIDMPALDTSGFLTNLPPIPDSVFSTPADNIPVMAPITVSYTPQTQDIPTLPVTTVNYTPNNASIPTLPLTTVTMPSPSRAAVSPSAPAPQQSTDWFTRNVMPLLSTGLQAWATVKQYDTAANIAQANLQAQTAAIQKGLPVGVSPQTLLTRPTLTTQQLATMTPAQLQAYYANPAAYTGVSTGGGIMSSLGLGNMSTSTLLLLGGGSLLLMMMLTNKK